MSIYIGILSTGYLLLLTGLIRIRRIITNNLMRDQFNKKNKLFKQEVRKVENPYSINIKTEDGWLNIVNPFRATMVLGTPGFWKVLHHSRGVYQAAYSKGLCYASL